MRTVRKRWRWLAVAAALVGLARDRPRSEELGRAGRVRQERLFSVEAMTRGYAELLADLDRPAGDRSHEWETARQ